MRGRLNTPILAAAVITKSDIFNESNQEANETVQLNGSAAHPSKPPAPKLKLTREGPRAEAAFARRAAPGAMAQPNATQRFKYKTRGTCRRLSREWNNLGVSSSL
jgi:hypothetical protein